MDEDNEYITALLYNVKEIADREARSLGKETSPEFVLSLTEVLASQIKLLGQDLEAFARHGRRSVISMEDVKLCARRNDTLYEVISETAKEIAEDANKRKQRKL